MKTLNWKKLARNTVHNSHLSLWKECTQLQESLVVDEDTIVDLFCRPEIKKNKKEEKSKEPSVVSGLVYYFSDVAKIYGEILFNK